MRAARDQRRELAIPGTLLARLLNPSNSIGPDVQTYEYSDANTWHL